MLNNLNIDIDTMVRIFIASSVIMGAWQWFAPSSIMQVHFVHDFNQMCNMNNIISNLCEKLTWLASTNGVSNVIIAYMTYVIHSMPKSNYKKKLSLAIITLHLYHSFQTFNSAINVYNNSNSILNVMLMSIYTFVIGVVVKMFIFNDIEEKQKQKMMDEMAEIMEHYPYVLSIFNRPELTTSKNLNVHTNLENFPPPPPVNTPQKSPILSNYDFRLPDAAQNTHVCTSEECISFNNSNSDEHHEHKHQESEHEHKHQESEHEHKHQESEHEHEHKHQESEHLDEHHHEHNHESEHLDEHNHESEHLDEHNHEHNHESEHLDEHNHESEHLDEHHHEHNHESEHLDEHLDEHNHESEHLDEHHHEHNHEHDKSENAESNCLLF